MAGYTELLINQKASFNTTITIEESNGTARNLAGYSANTEMRKSYASDSVVTITTTISDSANGVIDISLTKAQTTNLTAGKYVFDLVTTNPSGITQRILEGIVVVSPGVTD